MVKRDFEYARSHKSNDAEVVTRDRKVYRFDTMYVVGDSLVGYSDTGNPPVSIDRSEVDGIYVRDINWAAVIMIPMAAFFAYGLLLLPDT